MPRADRLPSAALEQMLAQAKDPAHPKFASDICEHLDVLRSYAEKCDHVTEFGTRNANGSTIAFLAAQPDTFIAWDINPLAIVAQNVLDLVYEKGRTNFQPRCGSTLDLIMEPTDMLFIDTLHTGAQLQAELVRHADPIEGKVKRFLAFHDTVTFGYEGEDGNMPGLRPVIGWFQSKHAFPLWSIVEDRKNNNGLVVLERVGS